MEQRNNEQNSVIFQIEGILNKMSNQVSFLIRNNKLMNQLDVDLLMENTRKLYDTLCSVKCNMDVDSIPMEVEEGVEGEEVLEGVEDLEEEKGLEGLEGIEGIEEEEGEEELEEFDDEEDFFEQEVAEDEEELEELEDEEESYEQEGFEDEEESFEGSKVLEFEDSIQGDLEDLEGEEESYEQEDFEDEEESFEGSKVLEFEDSIQGEYEEFERDFEEDMEEDLEGEEEVEGLEDEEDEEGSYEQEGFEDEAESFEGSKVLEFESSAPEEQDSGIRAYKKVYTIETQTLGDKLEAAEDTSLAARLQRKPVSDLASAIGINDKFLLLNELFGGSMEKYNKSIRALNNFSTLLGAKTYMSELQIEFQWNCESDAYKKLDNLVERRFM